MRVIVPIKEVALLEDGFTIEGTSVPETNVRYELNEWDEYALEEAVQLSEGRGDVEVVTVTIGPDRTEETIRKALAKGADRAIRIWDETLGRTELLAPLMKARILKAVIDEESPRLVLTGVQGGDDAFAATGTALAGLLDFQWAAVVNNLEIDLDDGVASAHRELEGGLTELVDVELPAVFSIQSGINQPRYASLRGIRMAQRKPLDAKQPEEFGLVESDLLSPFDFLSLYEPSSDANTQYFDGEVGTKAAALSDLLVNLGVVEE